MQTNRTTNVILGIIAIALIVIVILFLVHKNTSSAGDLDEQSNMATQQQNNQDGSNVQTTDSNQQSSQEATYTGNGFSFGYTGNPKITTTDFQNGVEVSLTHGSSPSLIQIHFYPNANDTAPFHPKSSGNSIVIGGKTFSYSDVQTNGMTWRTYEYSANGGIIAVTFSGVTPSIVDLGSVQISSNPTQQSSATWNSTTTPGFVVSYNSNWTVSPYTYAPPAEQSNPQITGYTFTLPSGSIIQWGGPQASCPSGGSSFQYGVSTQACVKGLETEIRTSNVNISLSQADKNAFGDFVQHNQ